MTHRDLAQKPESVKDLFAAHAWCQKQLSQLKMFSWAMGTCLLSTIIGWGLYCLLLVNHVSLAPLALTASTVSGLLGVSLGLPAFRIHQRICHKQDQVDECLERMGLYKIMDASPASLPKSGTFWLMLFLPKKVREPLLGDLEEEYQVIHEQFGERPAKLWFYKQILTSLWPMLQTTGRTLAKWGLIGWLEEFIRRIAH